MVSGVREHPAPSLVASPRPAVLAPVVVQLVLPITVVLIGDATGAERMLRQRRYRRPACHARAEQLVINLQEPKRHHPRVQCQRPPHCRPRRQRPMRPHAAADALALEHMDLAEKIAGNFARRTVHPKEDLLQLAMIGLIKAARRYDPSRLTSGVAVAETLERLGLSREQWIQIVDACSVRVVAFPVE